MTQEADGARGRDWMADAACRDKPARRFTDPAGPHDISRALATCATCPVRPACLATALTHPVEADIGIWGGTTERTRRHIRNGRAIPGQVLGDRDQGLQETASTCTGAQAENRPDRGQPDPAVEASRAQPDPRPPELTVARDANGDYTDATGRVILFRLHGQPPWMLMIDGRPIARTDTLTEGRRIAWATLNEPASRRDTSARQPEPARHTPAVRT